MNYITRNGYDIDDPEIDEDGLEVLAESRETRVKTSRRPLRSVLYYMKGYESSISLTPVQLPARSKILQVRDLTLTYSNLPHALRYYCCQIDILLGTPFTYDAKLML